MHHLISRWLPKVELVYQSIDRLMEIQNPKGALNLLIQLNDGEYLQGAKIHNARKTWIELKFSCGDGASQPSGRLYYHRADDGKVLALVSIKENQEQDIRFLSR